MKSKSRADKGDFTQGRDEVSKKYLAVEHPLYICLDLI